LYAILESGIVFFAAKIQVSILNVDLRRWPRKSLQRLKNEAAGALFAVLLFLLFFEDAEGFAREIWAIYILGIENIANFTTSKLIQG